MASSLWVLLDDIATILDDVSVMTKVAVKKTAGVLGDDLALNSDQVAGVIAERELPVVWAVAKGSLVNKAILVPTALAISAFAPGLITPLLMTGGAYLCFEGFEKIAHKFMHGSEAVEERHKALVSALVDKKVDMVALEKEKIKGAVRTDFILSAEIIVIALGTVAGATFSHQVLVLVGIGFIMTVGVYGLVAGIVKLDDLGFLLLRQASTWKKKFGSAILIFAPYLMKSLSIAGTAAMFLVGGGIITHGFHAIAEFVHALGGSGFVGWILPTLINAFVGLLTGALTLAAVEGTKAVAARFRRR